MTPQSHVLAPGWLLEVQSLGKPSLNSQGSSPLPLCVLTSLALWWVLEGRHPGLALLLQPKVPGVAPLAVW